MMDYKYGLEHAINGLVYSISGYLYLGMEEDALNFADQYLALQAEHKARYGEEFRSVGLEILGPNYQEAIVSAQQVREFLAKERMNKSKKIN